MRLRHQSRAARKKEVCADEGRVHQLGRRHELDPMACLHQRSSLLLKEVTTTVAEQ